MALGLRATGRDGEYEIEGLGRVIRISEWRIGDVYDTIQSDATLTAGVDYDLFLNLTNKTRIHTNLRQQSKLPAKNELIITRIGAHIAQAYANTVAAASDVLKMSHATLLTFKLGERLVAEGPIFTFQSGYGMTGFANETGIDVITTGTASAAAAPELLVPQPVTPEDELNGTFSVPNNSWLNGGSLMPTIIARVCLYCFLHGFLTKPVSS